MNKFKVGDIIKCTLSRSKSVFRGGIYEVLEIDGINGDIYLSIDGKKIGWYYNYGFVIDVEANRNKIIEVILE